MSTEFGISDPATGQHDADRPDQDPDVQPEVVRVDIPHVEGELLLPGDGVPAADLREPGDSGPDVVAA